MELWLIEFALPTGSSCAMCQHISGTRTAWPLVGQAQILPEQVWVGLQVLPQAPLFCASLDVSM